MKKVLLPWPREKDIAHAIKDSETALDALKRIAEVELSPILSEEEWFNRGRGAYVICNPGIQLSRYNEFLENAKNLRMLQTFSVGYDYIDLKACTDKGIVVCNVGEVMAESVAQHTWALILAVSKRVVESDAVIRGGNWRMKDQFGIELHGKTLGLIGLGDIGGRVALKGALAFGMKILAYDPCVLPARAQLFNAKLVDLVQLLQESDVISLHCPLTPQTRHILGLEQLRLLKPSAILVNTARGPTIDEKALAQALQERALFGAGLDVFEEEPLSPQSPLRNLSNVVLTSHVASSTPEAFGKTWQSGIANITRFIRGEKPYWVVNPIALGIRK